MHKSHLYRTFLTTSKILKYLSQNKGFTFSRNAQGIMISPRNNKKNKSKPGVGENHSELATLNPDLTYKFPTRISYQKDGLVTMHNADFISESRFENAYLSGKLTGSWGEDYDLQWRVKVCCWAANQVKHLSGDFVECGVHKGGTAMAVSRYVEFEKLNKTFFLLDTYGKLHQEGSLGAQDDTIYQTVCKLFTGYNVKVIQGFIPETLSEITAEKIAYLSVDLNTAEPEVAVLNALWDRLVPGAIVVLDDYGWPGRLPQKQAHDAFAASKSLEVLPLPTGQGLIIKPPNGDSLK